jgi:cardiolipin synthase
MPQGTLLPFREMQSSSSSITTSDGHDIHWHDTGKALLDAELEAISLATKRILLEQYMFRASPVGERFRQALVDAARRGVEVVLLLDYVGSFTLPGSYFSELIDLGGKVVWFNPVRWRMWIFRDHRKLLAVDDTRAFLGGCNIAAEYDGDGVSQGWRDGGIAITGPVVRCRAGMCGSPRILGARAMRVKYEGMSVRAVEGNWDR